MDFLKVIENFRKLLARLGNESNCRACGKKIYWIKNKAGRSEPITEDGISHFADCPAAKSFRKAG